VGRDSEGNVVKSLTAIATLIGGIALAQAPAPSSDSAQPAAGDQSLKFEQNEKLSDQDKVSRSAGDVQSMREVLKVVLGMLEEARNAKDVVRLNCVNEKLTQVKGFIRIAEQSDIALQEAVAKGESGTADHEYTKIGIANQRVIQLRADAEACVSATGSEASGTTSVTVTTPADLPSTDTSATPPPPPTVSTPPPASPIGSE
jgi:hypothetical protein